MLYQASCFPGSVDAGGLGDMSWPGWHKISVRKPLAVFSVVWGAVMCTVAFCLNRDIPPGVVSVMVAIIPTAIGSYAASSAWEATKKDG
jgi:hypothetical protein